MIFHSQSIPQALVWPIIKNGWVQQTFHIIFLDQLDYHLYVTYGTMNSTASLMFTILVYQDRFYYFGCKIRNKPITNKLLTSLWRSYRICQFLQMFCRPSEIFQEVWLIRCWWPDKQMNKIFSLQVSFSLEKVRVVRNYFNESFWRSRHYETWVSTETETRPRQDRDKTETRPRQDRDKTETQF